MAFRVGDLEPRQLERLRREIVETLAANFAYPPFFDFRANRMVVRPIDRAKRNEIEQFVHSVNFGTLERIEVSSPELRRFVARLFQHYVEVNSTFARPRFERFLPGMRAHAARTAAQLQRSLLAHLERNAPSFGAPRQQPSWFGALHQSSLEHDDIEHNTRVLQATLLRRAGDAPGPYVPLGTRAPLASPASAPAAEGTHAAPAPATAMYSPSGQYHGPSAGGSVRDIPADLMQMYGAYLSDMEPEAYSASPQGRSNPVATPAPAARPGNGYQPPGVSGMRAGAAGSGQYGATFSEESRSDKLIFWQLRYQLEAYIRRATHSYGVVQGTGDPFGALDALRRSGFVDEADLRIAEGILALTDKVTAASSATLDDYRQAFMLYLLYHRSHLAG